jgi:glycerate dehydrogenase
MTFALLLELTQHVGHHAQTVREGRWTRSPDFCYWDYPLIELDGLTFGVVGFGRIGKMVGQLAEAFGMKVLTYSRKQPAAEMETLFRQSDIISLHCPLAPQTERLVNEERLAWMKPTAFLLNTSRGPLIDESALAKVLNEGRIAGAGLDVLAVEPPTADNPLLRAKNCLITPHIAWATRAARSRLMEAVVENVRAFLAGESKNVVT